MSKKIELCNRRHWLLRLAVLMLIAATPRAYGQATWTDPATGLMWAGQDNGSHLDWNDAQDYCAKMTLGSFPNWRMPTINELAGIYDPTNDTVFPSTGWHYHIKGGLEISGERAWGSGEEGVAWFLNFGDGGQDTTQSGASSEGRALCVRRPGEPRHMLARIAPVPTPTIAPAPATPPATVRIPAESQATVAAMLEAAKNEKLEFSGSERRVFDNGFDSAIGRCNSHGHNFSNPTSSWCMQASISIGSKLGKQHPMYKVALQRACVMRDDRSDKAAEEAQNIPGFCKSLGEYYESIGNYGMALGVYKYEDGCRSSTSSEYAYGPECLTAMAHLYQKLNDLDDERAVVRDICQQYSILEYCNRFSQLGGSVDLAAVRAQHESNVQDYKDRQERELPTKPILIVHDCVKLKIPCTIEDWH